MEIHGIKESSIPPNCRNPFLQSVYSSIQPCIINPPMAYNLSSLIPSIHIHPSIHLFNHLPINRYIKTFTPLSFYLSLSLPLSLSQRSPFNLWGQYFTFVAVFPLRFFLSFFGVGLPAYLSNHNPFSREHIFVVLTSFLLSCIGALSSIITGHRGLLFFEE